MVKSIRERRVKDSRETTAFHPASIEAKIFY
jgi:hypothetical protein